MYYVFLKANKNIKDKKIQLKIKFYSGFPKPFYGL
jgi:predicted transcriptional regulator